MPISIWYLHGFVQGEANQQLCTVIMPRPLLEPSRTLQRFRLIGNSSSRGRLDCSIKEPIRKVLGKAILNEVELVTLLCQVEAMVNEKPLTTIVENDMVKTITPSVL